MPSRSTRSALTCMPATPTRRSRVRPWPGAMTVCSGWRRSCAAPTRHRTPVGRHQPGPAAELLSTEHACRRRDRARSSQCVAVGVAASNGGHRGPGSQQDLRRGRVCPLPAATGVSPSWSMTASRPSAPAKCSACPARASGTAITAAAGCTPNSSTPRRGRRYNTDSLLTRHAGLSGLPPRRRSKRVPIVIRSPI